MVFDYRDWWQIPSRSLAQVQGRTADDDARTHTRATGRRERPCQGVGQNRRQERLRRVRARARRGLRRDGADRRRRHRRVGRGHTRTTHPTPGRATPRRVALSRLPEALPREETATTGRRTRGHHHPARTRRSLPRLSPGLFPPNDPASNSTPTGTARPCSPGSSTPGPYSRRSRWLPRLSNFWRTSRSAVVRSGD